MKGDSGSLSVAGSSAHPDGFVEELSELFQRYPAVDWKTMKDRMTRAALGLLLAGQAVVIEEPPNSGHLVLKEMTWGQEIYMVLKAFGADLVTN